MDLTMDNRNKIKDFAYYTGLSTYEVVRELNTHAERGLSEREIAGRMAQYGRNIVATRAITAFDILLRQLKSPFIYLLVIAAIISFFLENHIDAFVIIFVVVVNTVVGFFQEYRAAQALLLLQKYVAATGTVIRDGLEKTVLVQELVPGDVIVLCPGDIIPADVRIIGEQYISVDESVLTGESKAVRKSGSPVTMSHAEIFSASNIGFSGTTILSGKARAIVLFTGSTTTMGEIVHLSGQTVRLSGFEKAIGAFNNFIVRLMIVSLIVIFVANFILKAGSVDVWQLLIFSCALAISAIPEALPIVTTFALSQGALRLAQKKAVVKRLSAIEDLGNVEILCTDKTGTLTENSVQVVAVWPESKPDTFLYSAAVNYESPAQMMQAKGFDAASYDRLDEQSKQRLEQYEKVYEIPFDPDRRRALAVVQTNVEKIVIIRGAVDEVLALCVVSEDTKKLLQAWAQVQGLKGNRLLLIAKKSINVQQDLGDTAHLESDLQVVGAIAFGDPLKKTASLAVTKARELGIEVKILSGDAPEICGYIAYQIGLVSDLQQVVTGSKWQEASDFERAELAKNFAVFARVSPRQKYEIIAMLQKEKDVAYMGDGINDAPALKIANVALAVQDAAGVAREAADIILLKKSLLVIIDGIEEGRRVFANTLKYIRTTLSATFGNFYSVAVISLLVPYLPMLPVQLLLLNVISDLPMLGLATDTVSPDQTRRPAKYDTKNILLLGTILGVVSSLFDFIFFGFFHRLAPAFVQTSWFIFNIFTELLFIFSLRTFKPFYKAARPSMPLVVLTFGVAIITVLLPFTYIGQRYFHFVPISIDSLVTLGAIGVGYFFTTDMVKVLCQKFYGTK